MKKIISLLLAVLLLGILCLPAFAEEDEPIELEIGSDKNVCIEDDKSYIIHEDCIIRDLEIKHGKLIIAPGATVSVLLQFYGGETAEVEVWGTFIISPITSVSCASSCKFTVLCNGEISCPKGKLTPVRNVGHEFHNGVCAVCGYVCKNPFHSGTCPDCGMTVGTTATGSILSQGYPEIVFGIGGLVVGFLVAMFIFRKKKVVVNSTPADDEE